MPINFIGSIEKYVWTVLPLGYTVNSSPPHRMAEGSEMTNEFFTCPFCGHEDDTHKFVTVCPMCDCPLEDCEAEMELNEIDSWR